MLTHAIASYLFLVTFTNRHRELTKQAFPFMKETCHFVVCKHLLTKSRDVLLRRMSALTGRFDQLAITAHLFPKAKADFMD